MKKSPMKMPQKSSSQCKNAKEKTLKYCRRKFYGFRIFWHFEITFQMKVGSFPCIWIEMWHIDDSTSVHKLQDCPVCKIRTYKWWKSKTWPRKVLFVYTRAHRWNKLSLTSALEMIGTTWFILDGWCGCFQRWWFMGTNGITLISLQ